MSSRSGGERWTLVPGPAGVELSSLLAAPGAPDRLLATTKAGPVYAITNRGATWTPLGHVPGGDVSDLRADDSGTIVYGAQGDDLVRSADGGRTWHALPLPRPQFSRLDVCDRSARPAGRVRRDVGRSVRVPRWRQHVALRARGLTRAAAAIVVHGGRNRRCWRQSVPTSSRATTGAPPGPPFRTTASRTASSARSLASDGAGGVRLRAGSRTFRLRAGATAWAEDVVRGRHTGDGPAGDANRRGAASGIEAAISLHARWRDLARRVVAVRGDAFRGDQGRERSATPGGRHRRIAGARRRRPQQPVAVPRWRRDVDPHAGTTRRPSGALLRPPSRPERGQHHLRGTERHGDWRRRCRGAAVRRRGRHVGGSRNVRGRGGRSCPPGLPPCSRSTTSAASSAARMAARPGRRRIPACRRTPTVTHFAFDWRRPTTIFAATGSRGIYRSEDAGLSWTPTGHATRP